MANVILIGYSGHALVVTDIMQNLGHSIVGYFDLEPKRSNPYSLKYLGNESDLNCMDEIRKRDVVFALGLGDNHKRKKAFAFFTNSGFNAVTGIHTSAFVSPTAAIGDGTMVMPVAVVNAIASIGKGCIINSGAVVEHECAVSEFAHIGPSATLAGNVSIGEGSFIGANATIKQGVRIGNNVVVGAGSVVLKDIPDNETWAGVPARKLSR